MITKEDLQAAIAECQGQRNPNANTCIKLAAFYTIQDHLFGEYQEQVEPMYSYASGHTVSYSGESEFAQLVSGKDETEVMKIMDELMQTIQVINPRLYASVIRKCTNL